MSYKGKKYEAYITDDNKILIPVTPQEHKEIVLRGIPKGLRFVSKNKQEKRLGNADGDTAGGWKRSEISSEEFESLRQAEAEEGAKNA